MATELELQREWTRRLHTLYWKMFDELGNNDGSLNTVYRFLADELGIASEGEVKMEKKAKHEEIASLKARIAELEAEE